MFIDTKSPKHVFKTWHSDCVYLSAWINMEHGCLATQQTRACYEAGKMWRPHWAQNKVGYCLYIGRDLADQLIELRGKVTPWKRREFCSILLSDPYCFQTHTSFRPMPATCFSVVHQGDSLRCRLGLHVVLSQFPKTNRSLHAPAGSVCTTTGVPREPQCTGTGKHTARCSALSPGFWEALLAEDNSWLHSLRNI